MRMNNRKAAIDIGSNTALLLISEYNGKEWNNLIDEQRIPRLGRKVEKTGRIQEESIEKLEQAMKDFAQIIRSNSVDSNQIWITATSAFRDAENGNQVLDKIESIIGTRSHILSGDEEAERTYFGALSQIDNQVNRSFLIIDIGGGSTEFAIGSSDTLEQKYSLNMGCVRFTERYFPDEKIKKEQFEIAEKEVFTLLDRTDIKPLITRDTECIGVAGTVTSLAFIKKELKSYSSENINETVITLDDIANLKAICMNYGCSYLAKKYPVVMSGRSDIFAAGLAILSASLYALSLKTIRVSTGGIRHGTILAYQ